MTTSTPIHPAPESATGRQALALAGVFQAASLVDELARTGHVEQRAWETLMHATLETSPANFESIYGGHPNNLRPGLDALDSMLGRRQANPMVMRYGFGMLMLMGKLRGNTGMMDDLGQRLARTRAQAEHFGETHENIIASLGEAYQQTLSTLKTRIVVQGDPSLLQSRMMPERVRACLLAGVRFALLWHQQGGRRWKLLFQRGALKKALDTL
ncbi:high frequency lysogenization protein HflD [Halomonas sabkhae]|uniref:High frequency lysogenization protein HflD homolog n=1 Tax=Halomonas halmophila TaxID=252 RepID=A0A4Y4F2C1_9GAMM|nr:MULTISPECIES: high frequency lysogenization protein HflD [Halomonas]MDN3526087.1 high frequency lysogenization protein HflD [Halomonas sabkhae]GED21730.1 high frequency lysogenization protein HflD [Halomonas halmophila]